MSEVSSHLKEKDLEAPQNDDFDQQVGDYEDDQGSAGSESNVKINQGESEENASDKEDEKAELSAEDDGTDDESNQKSEEITTQEKTLKANGENGGKAAPVNASSSASKQPAKSFWKFDESSSDDDDAPEEVGNTSMKQETLDLYQRQKEAAMA